MAPTTARSDAVRMLGFIPTPQSSAPPEHPNTFGASSWTGSLLPAIPHELPSEHWIKPRGHNQQRFDRHLPAVLGPLVANPVAVALGGDSGEQQPQRVHVDAVL